MTVESLPGLLLVNLGVVMASMLILWVVSLALRDASIVDLFWGFGFVIVAWVSWWAMPRVGSLWLVGEGGAGGAGFSDPGARRLALLVIVSAWGLRLTAYLTWRNVGKGEDRRYAAMRRRWGDRFPLVSLGTVFALQGILMWVVSLPVQVGMFDTGGLGMLAATGLAVWVAGLTFETAGDAQLARFTRDPDNDGEVMDRGLWRYTRHPNYFGDFLVWWGIYLVALTTTTWWTAVGPAIMTVLLLRFSGVALLERTISSRRPGYAEYARRTNAFFPGPPKGAGDEAS